MILKEIGSRISITNLLTDFILNKIPQDEESIIQVVDCINFYIIKGKTSHNEVLDLPKVVGEFIKKFDVLLEGTKVSHTIDLIEYNCDINKPTEYIFSFFNSSNCWKVFSEKSILKVLVTIFYEFFQFRESHFFYFSS